MAGDHSETPRGFASDGGAGGESAGGGRVGIMNRTRIGCTLACGGNISAISITVMPIDHTSARPSYLLMKRQAEPPRDQRC